MDTKAITKEYRLTQWRQQIRDHKASGLSVREYCEQMGLSENSYYYWLKQLRKAASDQISKHQASNVETIQQPRAFTEVKLMVQPDQLHNDANANHELHIEVSGVQITTNSGYPVDRLAALLRELKRP